MMVKHNILRRFFSLTLVSAMVTAMIPAVTITAFAAETLSGLTVEDLSAEYEDGSWTASGTSIEGSASGSVVDSGCSGSEAGTSTLTLTNKKESAAKLMFQYTVTLNSGSVTVGGTPVPSDGTYSYSDEIEADGQLDIVITSAAGKNYTTSISITDLILVVESTVTTTFAAAEHGSYTVNGTEITQSTTYTQSSTTAYALAATPADGYQFLGWYSTTDEKYLSTDASTDLYIPSDQTVTAAFCPVSSAVFETGGGRFTDLNKAVAYAQRMNASRITLVADGSLPAGSYTIPSGIILLIPFDEAGTCYTTEPAVVSNSNTKPAAYRTLTMEDGASLEVYGGISVSAKVSSAAGAVRYGSAPTDSSGRIVMNSGSSITVKDGGSLYAWGFITGPLSGNRLSRGTITAESGASVYECFQIADFRGGTASATCVSEDIFPFSQWYVQNVEVPLTLCSGAAEYVFAALYASGSDYTTNFTLVAQDSGMFRLTGSDTAFVKSYDPYTDRVTLEVQGDATVGSISMNVAGVTIDSSDYVLPVNSNITLNILAGTTAVEQDIKFLPGVQVSIANDAALHISSGHQAIVYDSSDWVGHAYVLTEWDLRAVKYVPTRTTTRTSSSLTDVTVDVNGTILVDGSFQTTSGGAAITSSEGGGRVILNTSASSSTTINELAENSSASAVTITAARLLNGGDTYTDTAGASADTTYIYNKSVETWIMACAEHTAGDAVIENEIAAACTEAGSYDSVVSCSVCGEEISRETITVEATGHTYDDGNVTKEAACTEDGEMTYTCTVCGAVSIETISALGHSWGEGEVTTPATSTEEGVMTYTCSRCGATRTEAIFLTVTTTFAVAENGSYTVNGTEITESASYAQLSTVAYTLEAAPADGYQFLGWYSMTDESYLSTSASVSLCLSSDQTVTAVFCPASSAVFETGGGRFTDLNEAVAYAQRMNASRITLVADGSLPAGSYTIPAGIILLIPFDEDGTCYTTEPDVVANKYSEPDAYRTLTMEDGASLVVYGGVSVSAQVASASQNARYGSAPTASSGRIVMNSGSSITVKSGGSLYAWGYITGPLSGDMLSRGTIAAESGASVYECFQIADFRGSAASQTCVDNGVFPFSQWYVHNILVPLTLHSGAAEYVFAALYYNRTNYTTSFTLVAQDSGMFQLTGSDTAFVKSYDPYTDRVTLEVQGDATWGSISLSVLGISVDSTDYVFPVNSNITLNILAGTTTVSQDIELLPGVQVSIAEGAALDISDACKAVVYDRDDWVGQNFVTTAYDLLAVKHVPKRSTTRTSSSLTDVTVDVNGTIHVNGSFYTTSGGAAITSSAGGGQVILNTAAPSSTTVSEMTGNSSITTVRVTAAQLLNGDGTYTATEGASANTTYTYSKTGEKWTAPCTEHTAGEAVIENEVAAACTESGSYDSVVSCTVCGEEISRETITVAATGHSYDEAVVTAPTYTDGVWEPGYTTYTCTVCGDFYEDDYTVAVIWEKGVTPTSGYSTLSNAVADYETGTDQVIQLIADIKETENETSVTIGKDVYLDLNGHTVSVDITVSDGSTLYGIDTATDNYDESGCGQITGTVKGTVASYTDTTESQRTTSLEKAKKYLTVTNGKGGMEFHRFNIVVYKYTGTVDTAGSATLNFTLGFQGDSTVVEQMTAIGAGVRLTGSGDEYEHSLRSDVEPRQVDDHYEYEASLVGISNTAFVNGYTTDYDLVGSLEFNGETTVDSVSVTRSFLEILRLYYDGATEDEQAVINTFIDANDLNADWE